MTSAKIEPPSETTYSIEYWTTNLNENAAYVVFSRYAECLLVTTLPLVALCYLNYKIAGQIKKSANFKHRYTCSVPRHRRVRRTSSLTAAASHHRSSHPRQLELSPFGGATPSQSSISTSFRRNNSFEDSFRSSTTGSSILLPQSPSLLRTRSETKPNRVRIHRNPL